MAASCTMILLVGKLFILMPLKKRVQRERRTGGSDAAHRSRMPPSALRRQKRKRPPRSREVVPPSPPTAALCLALARDLVAVARRAPSTQRVRGPQTVARRSDLHRDQKHHLSAQKAVAASTRRTRAGASTARLPQRSARPWADATSAPRADTHVWPICEVLRP